MSKEKQIEEMAQICTQKCKECHNTECRKTTKSQHCIAETLYNAGYCRQNEWISVKDDTPKDGEKRVQVFLRDDDFTKSIGSNKIDTDRYIDGKWVRWGKYVTHWMPLPEPPKGE